MDVNNNNLVTILVLCINTICNNKLLCNLFERKHKECFYCYPKSYKNVCWIIRYTFILRPIFKQSKFKQNIILM